MVMAGRIVPLDVTLARNEVKISPVVVYGRSNLTGWRAGFYSCDLRDRHLLHP